MTSTRQNNLQSLSAPRRRLVRMLQRLNFGTIEGLVVRSGEPSFSPAPRMVRSWKFGSGESGRQEHNLTAFVLKEPVSELLDALETIGDGVILCLEVRHGLPFRMLVEEQA